MQEVSGEGRKEFACLVGPLRRNVLPLVAGVGLVGSQVFSSSAVSARSAYSIVFAALCLLGLRTPKRAWLEGNDLVTQSRGQLTRTPLQDVKRVRFQSSRDLGIVVLETWSGEVELEGLGRIGRPLRHEVGRRLQAGGHLLSKSGDKRAWRRLGVDVTGRHRHRRTRRR